MAEERDGEVAAEAGAPAQEMTTTETDIRFTRYVKSAACPVKRLTALFLFRGRILGDCSGYLGRHSLFCESGQAVIGIQF